MQKHIWGCQYYLSRICIYYQGIRNEEKIHSAVNNLQCDSYSVEKKLKSVRGMLKPPELHHQKLNVGFKFPRM